MGAEPTAALAPDALPAEVEGWLEGDGEDAGATDAAAPLIDPALAPRIARRRARVERQARALRERFEAEVRELTLWRDAEQARLNREAARLDWCLECILDAERAADPKRKSLRLPYGVTVRARTHKATFTRDASAAPTKALLRMLSEGAGDADSPYVRRVAQVEWDALKGALSATPDGRVVLADTGEALPDECGVRYEPGGESVTVTVAQEGDA